MNVRTLILTLAGVVLTGGIASATVTIDMVPVGNINNAADPSTGNIYGSVGYAYSIGKCEITAGQYTEFLNAVASTSDSYGLYSSDMATTVYGSQITKSGSVYTAVLPNEPVNYVSWGDAARFCNWLQNGQKTYAQDPLTTEIGSYTLNGYTDPTLLMTVLRNTGFQYYIPTENEWYKAAYYDPSKVSQSVGGYWLYPTKSDAANPPTNVYPSSSNNNANYYINGYTLSGSPYTTPVGSFTNSQSAYGTLDQGGNIFEWNETALPEYASRVVRGGSFGDDSVYLASSNRIDTDPAHEDYQIGFRVVSVPEPGSLAMLLMIAMCELMYWKRRNA
jgi:formylglycine-generating enzyme